VLPLLQVLRANCQSWGWDEVDVAVSFAVSHATAIGTAWGVERQMAGLERVDENFFGEIFEAESAML
jgi:hypothetical protein